MARNTWEVPIPKGYYISWFITTQAANRVSVTLKDEYATYFAKEKQSTSIDPPLAIGSGFIDGASLVLIVDIPGSTEIFGEPHSSDILTKEGIVVGKVFNLFLEDGVDKDYNDVAINITGWKSKD
ncbi:MAG: hypothetical protein LBD89_02365 [Tannerellaceae bacterium]|jgi:hypothetical protein|nr:hypothetical protein [Tannerellaceae bacterium]